jgi:hypothetical protein
MDFSVFEERPTATLQNSENTRLATMNDLSAREVIDLCKVHTVRPHPRLPLMPESNPEM